MKDKGKLAEFLRVSGFIFHLLCLGFGLAAGVPEVGDMDGVVRNVINHLIQVAHHNTVVSKG